MPGRRALDHHHARCAVSTPVSSRLDGGTPTQISNDFAMSATLSPDGRYVASFSFGAGGRQDVVLRAVETGAAQRSRSTSSACP